MFKKLKPIFVENSSVPKYLSYLVPFEISAITLFCIVFSRGKISKKTRLHETIHFQQYLETLVVGFLLIYAVEYIIGLFRFRDRRMAYRMISFEQEAYMYDDVEYYLDIRKRFEWLKFIS
jgi:uncharacterized membrane protein